MAIGDFIPAFALVAGTVSKIGGGLQSASAAIDAGAAQKVAAEYTAAQYDQNAGQVIASQQRKALEVRKQAQLMASHLLAVRGSGGGVDASVINQIAKIGQQGAYAASVALYDGEEQARKMRMAAEAKRYEGSVAERGGNERATAYRFGAAGDAVKGVTTLYDKYWPKGGFGNSEYGTAADVPPDGPA